MDNKNLFYLKEFKFTNFFDYLALELNFDNNYKFSDYYKLLETIKHFYNLSNVTVIIASNNKELQNTIKKQYGQNFFTKKFWTERFTIY